MSTATDQLPLTETIAPADQPALAAAVRDAFASETPIYPIGGGTSLDYGLPGRRAGIGLSLENLNRVVDYPARDMTITVEAGITIDALAKTLATEKQWLPVDAPQPELATLGGLVATAFSGPRRYGWGTMRDYVIGISAVDGRGIAFKGGGRVVKNVAGYDFCKLLTGSLGSLGVITQITLKIKPRPQKSALLVCDLTDLATAERLLAALVTSATTPAAIELLTGPFWLEDSTPGATCRLAVGLEGTAAEVDWMLTTLAAEWREQGVTKTQTLTGEAADELWTRLREFPALRTSPLVVKASMRPSAVIGFAQLIRTLDPGASVQAHAGSGIVIVRFAEFPAADISRVLVGKLHPATVLEGGHLVVLSSEGLGELTRQVVWGGVEDSLGWMAKVKQQFDPLGLLNPGRFLYPN